MNERCYAFIEWENIGEISQGGYRLFINDDVGNMWENISTNYRQNVNILNVYPDIPASNTLKGWIEQEEVGLGLVEVTPISISDYNQDPENALKDSTGEYKYDVLFFGSWDSNNSLDLNSSSAKSTKEFIDSARGVLFGHDTIGRGRINFNSFADDLGIYTFGTLDNPWGINFSVGSSVVQITDNGYLMKYPHEFANNMVLNIPFTHSSVQMTGIDSNRKWLEFVPPFGLNTPSVPGFQINDPIYGTNNFYLITKGNVGLIQTGHSSGQSTEDEMKILVNTLYNLAQVSFNTFADDYTVTDDKEPNHPTIDPADENTFENFTLKLDSEDQGNTYQWKVEAEYKDLGELTSDIVQETITSNIAGYFYRFKTDGYNEEDFLDEVEGFKNEFGRIPKDVYDLYVAPETGSLTVYDTTASLTLNGRELFEEYGAEDLSLMVIAVDRANNVSQVTTEHLEPLLLELIPEVEVTIDPLTEHPQEVHSYTITGTATPNSFIRFSGDAAIPEGTIVTPHADSNEKFHTIADDEGNYSFVLPEGSHFTGGNEVVAYAFFDWKSATASTIVTDGFLTLDFVSPIDFGNQKIAAQDRTYYAHSYVASDKAQPNYVQISDRRAEGDRDGWQLAVTQRAQFKGEKDQYLEGAVLRLENAELIGSADNEPRKETSVIELMPAAQEILVHASDYQGKGTWKFCFGDQASADKSIALDVPSGANPEAIRYSATLDWVLISGPGN
ncbi:WxL domain-containing protein [Candidatus Enterococcus testudinis]|nr:WxL domain-containing protein [Enterococcus sp. 8G7_MSG3316]